MHYLQHLVKLGTNNVGPPDGVGGRVKTEADHAALRGQAIRNVDQLFEFVKETFENIQPILVKTEELKEHNESLKERYEHAKQVKGSRSAHQFSSVAGSNDQVSFRRNSDAGKSKTAHVTNFKKK